MPGSWSSSSLLGHCRPVIMFSSALGLTAKMLRRSRLALPSWMRTRFFTRWLKMKMSQTNILVRSRLRLPAYTTIISECAAKMMPRSTWDIYMAAWVKKPLISVKLSRFSWPVTIGRYRDRNGIAMRFFTRFFRIGLQTAIRMVKLTGRSQIRFCTPLLTIGRCISMMRTTKLRAGIFMAAICVASLLNFPILNG